VFRCILIEENKLQLQKGQKIRVLFFLRKKTEKS